MNADNARMVLSGGNARRPFFDAVFELCGTEKPHILIDLSAKVDSARFDESRKIWKWAFDKLNLPNPTWLQDAFTDEIRPETVSNQLDSADVLLVSGGSTRRAVRAWQEAGITSTIVEHVVAGDVVAAGGSTGAMIWFNEGFSDSNKFEVTEGEQWDYEMVASTGIISAWVNPHHSDVDEFGRLRSEKFEETLAERKTEWNRAFGIDSNAALYCEKGRMRAINLSSPDVTGPHNVYMYVPSSTDPIVLPSN